MHSPISQMRQPEAEKEHVGEQRSLVQSWFTEFCSQTLKQAVMWGAWLGPAGNFCLVHGSSPIISLVQKFNFKDLQSGSLGALAKTRHHPEPQKIPSSKKISV